MTFLAEEPRLLVSISKATRSPSESVLKPGMSMDVW